MLTWGLAWYCVRSNEHPTNFVPFIIAMGCDVAIFYYAASTLGARL